MRRIPELDALRGLAALAIVAYHLWLIRYAALGTAVDLFFVLSGYLITSILLKHQGTRGFLPPFYARRALRIWPIYYLTLLALVAVNPLLPRPQPLAGLPYYVTYTQNLPAYWFGRMQAIPALQHTWSLAVEEQFYLFWPALVLLVGRRHLIPLCLGFLGLSVWARAMGFSPWILLTKCDGLALGSLLAALVSGTEDATGRARRLRWAFAGSIAAAVGLRVLTRGLVVGPWAGLARSVHVLLTNVVYFGVSGLVVGHAGRGMLGWLRGRWLCYLGQISYGLYLYHHVVFEAVSGLDARAGWRQDALKLALSFGLAVLSWEFIERPILALKDRFAYRPEAAPAPAPAPASGLACEA